MCKVQSQSDQAFRWGSNDFTKANTQDRETGNTTGENEISQIENRETIMRKTKKKLENYRLEAIWEMLLATCGPCLDTDYNQKTVKKCIFVTGKQEYWLFYNFKQKEYSGYI